MSDITPEQPAPRQFWSMLGRAARTAGVWTRELVYPTPVEEPPELDFMNTRRIVGRGRLIILIFVIGFFGWAALAPLGSALMAPGVIVVESHRKAIQHLEGGIVRDIRVADGQLVTAGQLLILLDDAQARSSLDMLTGEADALAAQEARLSAERDGKDHIAFPADLTARAADPHVADAMQGEINTFTARRATLAKQIDILTERNAQNDRIVGGLRFEAKSIDQQSALIDQETASVQALYAKGLSTLPRLLALQRQAADLGGQRGQIAEKIAQTELSSGENELQIVNLKNQQLSDVVKDLRDVETKRFDLLDRLKGAHDVLSRLTITAPVSGRIVELSVHTKGAVIKPGETVMEIVPQKDALEVEAHVRPEDADSIYAGMSARVNLSAYQQRRLPVIDGTVTEISADRITDPRTGQAYFTVQLTVDRAPLKDYPDTHIIPGMPVEVAIDTGTRTALDYFVEPITDVFRRGMRER
ncbi:MAG TPA: HlyD family type I secretion periplasmic adaptor subunit [Rhizomicrobium sp.]|jgi:HlyD family type I secretion membrane fusion protein|nr:HlyD family type I secretion periplasmic adaptor subunit [Rhizomicrobium sp.]